MPAAFENVLAFWFGAPDSPELGRARNEWFRKDPAFDAQIRERFLQTFEAAAAGALDAWAQTPYGALALVVGLDQFPRNLFRDDVRAFSTDTKALETAQQAIGQGFDAPLRWVERGFLYLPFEHSEDLAMQRRSLELFASLGEPRAPGNVLDYA